MIERILIVTGWMIVSFAALLAAFSFVALVLGANKIVCVLTIVAAVMSAVSVLVQMRTLR